MRRPSLAAETRQRTSAPVAVVRARQLQCALLRSRHPSRQQNWGAEKGSSAGRLLQRHEIINENLPHLPQPPLHTLGKAPGFSGWLRGRCGGGRAARWPPPPPSTLPLGEQESRSRENRQGPVCCTPLAAAKTVAIQNAIPAPAGASGQQGRGDAQRPTHTQKPSSKGPPHQLQIERRGGAQSAPPRRVQRRAARCHVTGRPEGRTPRGCARAPQGLAGRWCACRNPPSPRTPNRPPHCA